MATIRTAFKPEEFKIDYAVSVKAAELGLIWRVERVFSPWWNEDAPNFRFAWRRVGKFGQDETTIFEPQTSDPEKIIAAVIAAMELSC